jgi:hypothetical protein
LSRSAVESLTLKIEALSPERELDIGRAVAAGSR